jgi:anti-sigma factor RsiW
MTMNPASPVPLSDADIQAFVDGQLAPDRAERAAGAIASNPEIAARVADMRSRNALLREALEPVLAEPIPERLLEAAQGRRRATAAVGWLGPAFALAATLALGIGLGWFVRDVLIERTGTPTTFARQAAFAHALYADDANRPVEIWAADEKRLVGWLSKRLGFGVHAPDLNGIGYALVGGRLVAGNENPTALFMYENADKDRLSLQVRKRARGTGEVGFRYAVENGVGVFYWIDDACGYAISGKLDRAQLLKVAQIVNTQLTAFEAAEPQ